ncbi:DUF4118 domain-containing protein [Glutamicibacter sp. JL.03c]|uniref:ATP-binding protein n=1 Tax=Glutamicibacter sp. JL.03c TaxID=2984842 RepID=UPI0021F72732|nr:ATP-binding protein [Glutamicibacter sp. JL.03c]UYQ77255.1 DUF4118 domain-containing protein [Glutamicibacter sp. JL.03c]
MDVSDAAPQAHPLLIVALSGRSGSEALLRRACREASKMPGAEVMAVHVPQRGVGSPPDALQPELARLRALADEAGASWHMVLGQGLGDALLGFARSIQATHLIVGAPWPDGPRKNREEPVCVQLLEQATEPTDPSILVFPLQSQPAAPARRTRHRAGGQHRLGAARRVLGWLLALTGPLLLAAGFLLGGLESELLTLNFLSQLTLVVFVALLGGWWPALTAALLSTAILNWFFTPPTGQWHIHEPFNILALVLFLVVAAGVARVVDIEARRTAEAGQARHQADTLFELSGGVIREGLSVPALLEWLRRSYQLQGVALVQRGTGPASEQQLVASAGAPPADAQSSDYTVTVDAEHLLLINGNPREASDQGIFEAFAGRISAVLQQRALAEARLNARELSAGNEMRTALLAAVSHDLRTPLSGIKASASSLRLQDVVLSEQDTADLLATIEESADQLSERIEDLLSMSRIQAGELVVHRSPLQVEDLVASALRDVSGILRPSHIQLHLPDDCPRVSADYGLAVRVLANLLENAVRYGGEQPLQLRAVPLRKAVQIQVIDHGVGVPEAEKDRIFRPFQRHGDRSNTTGLGLGLAVARGLAAGMDGDVHAQDTAGGGATMVFTLPIFEEAA